MIIVMKQSATPFEVEHIIEQDEDRSRNCDGTVCYNDHRHFGYFDLFVDRNRISPLIIT